MKNYRIIVNGSEYNVEVEEVSGAVESRPVQQAPKATPKAAPALAKPVASATSGSVKISSPMPGKIVGIKSNIGDSVKKGQVILVLEAMKMENEIVATQDGKVASINVTVGQTVEAGDTLASLN